MFPFIDIEEMGAGSAVTGHLAIHAHDVEPFRCRAVGLVDGIIHLLDQNGYADAQIKHAGIGHGLPLAVVLMLLKQDTLGGVAVALPPVDGMGFLNVDDENSISFRNRL